MPGPGRAPDAAGEPPADPVGVPRPVGLRAALFDVPAVDRATWDALGAPLRLLIAARASVLAMTLFASLFGGLLALPWSAGDAVRLAVGTAALLLAHATNNLLNDHVDWRLGLDRDNYFRARYGAHPLAQGLMDPAAHRRLIIVTGGSALALAIAVGAAVGGAVWWLAGAGAAFLLFYTWPLKHFALGEVAVFLVWGPLMVAGSCLVAGGPVTADVLWLAALFGLGPSVVIFAKHTDKRADDLARGIRTLPVLLGPTAARWSWAALAVLQLGGACGLALATGRPGLLLLLGAVPALARCVRLAAAPRPSERPAGYPAHVWPLWYTAAAFRYARLSGLLLVIGVIADRFLH
jgi:1,4-dihydroxy-2-naphthoate octaprenyltransferase